MLSLNELPASALAAVKGVSVYRDVGQGTVFEIYLPRVEAELPAASAIEVSDARAVTGAVLVVEDEEDLRTVICDFLKGRAYTVLEASNGAEALAVAAQYAGNIDLLLTDVIMPEMRGPDLAEKIVASRPQIRVIYMSGYTENALPLDIGRLREHNATLLQKPFRMEELAARVKGALDETILSGHLQRS